MADPVLEGFSTVYEQTMGEPLPAENYDAAAADIERRKLPAPLPLTGLVVNSSPTGLTPRAGPLAEPRDVVPSTAFGRTLDDGTWEPGYIQSAFGLENDVVAGFEFLSRPSFSFNPKYGVSDIAETLKGTEFENWLEPFYNDVSPEETLWRAEQIRKEMQRRDIAARGGIGGAVAMFAASAASPTVFIPVAGWLGASAKAGRAAKVGISALEGAGAAAAGVAIQEGVLQATQELRTGSESAWNIGTAAVLGVVLGGGLGLLSRSELDRMADNLDAYVLGDDVVGGDGAMGAASSRLEPGDSHLVGAVGGQKVASRMSAGMRLQTSPLPASRDAARRLAISSLEIEANRKGVATTVTGSAEAQANIAEQIYVPAIKAAREQYKLYGKETTGVRMTEREFLEQAFDALLSKDVHENPFVARAAKEYRSVFEYYKREGIDLGVLPEDVKPLDDPSYVNRIWLNDVVGARRDELVQIIKRYNEDELIPHIRARLEDLEARTGAEVDELDRAHVSLDGQELEDAIEEALDTILGYAPNRVMQPSDFAAGKRGPLAERTVRVPTKLVKDFVETNPEALVQRYAKTMASDLALIRKFGSIDLEDAINKIRDDGRRLSNLAKTQKERAKISKRTKADIEDLLALRDKVRGTFGIPKNPHGVVSAGIRTVKALNMYRLMGFATLGSVADPGKIVFQHGLLSAFRDGFIPYTKGLAVGFKNLKAPLADVKAFGAAADMLTHSRAATFAGIEDSIGQLSKFEKGVSFTTDLYFKWAALLTPWTSMWKVVNVTVAQTRALRAVEKIASGRSASKFDAKWLAVSGIDANVAERIYKQFAKHGGKENGTYWSHITAWDDREAARAMRALMARENKVTIVEPSAGDLPNMATDAQGPLGQFGPIAFQFKSFGISSIQKTLLSGLQRRDMAVLNGTMVMLALGALSHAAIQAVRGEDLTEITPEQWAAEAVDRSGILGALMDVNAFSEKVTRGRVGLMALTGEQLSRYRSRGVSGALLGPTADWVEDMVTLTGALSAGDWIESDTHRLRKMLPLQNAFYLRQLFDAAERGANDAMGVKDTRR